VLSMVDDLMVSMVALGVMVSLLVLVWWCLW